ncbi:MAG: hypothetical protein LH603_17080 [Pseudonocardia sp.]|nr:hypothetical protein [Pseudonocardia sp.]
MVLPRGEVLGERTCLVEVVAGLGVVAGGDGDGAQMQAAERDGGGRVGVAA